MHVILRSWFVLSISLENISSFIEYCYNSVMFCWIDCVYSTTS